MGNIRSTGGSEFRGASSVPETLVLTCVLAVSGLLAVLPVTGFDFSITLLDFDDPGEVQLISPPDVDGPHALTVVTTICAGLAVACGLAAFVGGIVFLVKRLRGRAGLRVAQVAAWAGVLGLLLALIGVLHGLHVLVQEHPQAPLSLGQGKELEKLFILLAVGAVALFLGFVPGLAAGPRSVTFRAGIWILLAAAALSTGMAIAAFRAFTFWQRFSLLDVPQRPTDVSHGAILAAGGCVVALGSLVLAAVMGRRARRAHGSENGPEPTGRSLHVAAPVIVVFVVLIGLRLVIRSSAEDPAGRFYVPESFMATLHLAVVKCGGFGVVLGVCLSLLALIAAWSWLSRGRSARPGWAAAWIGGIVVGVVLLGVADGMTDIVMKIEKFGAALTPQDFQGILLANSVVLLGVPVFLAARALAWSHALTRRCADPRVPSPWPDRIRRGSLAVLVTGAAATGVSFRYWSFYDPTPTLLRWGAIVWIAGLAVCAALSVVAAIRAWLASVPTRRRRAAYRRRRRSDECEGVAPVSEE